MVAVTGAESGILELYSVFLVNFSRTSFRNLTLTNSHTPKSSSHSYLDLNRSPNYGYSAISFSLQLKMQYIHFRSPLAFSLLALASSSQAEHGIGYVRYHLRANPKAPSGLEGSTLDRRQLPIELAKNQALSVWMDGLSHQIDRPRVVLTLSSSNWQQFAERVCRTRYWINRHLGQI